MSDQPLVSSAHARGPSSYHLTPSTWIMGRAEVDIAHVSVYYRRPCVARHVFGGLLSGTNQTILSGFDIFP